MIYVIILYLLYDIACNTICKIITCKNKTQLKKYI